MSSQIQRPERRTLSFPTRGFDVGAPTATGLLIEGHAAVFDRLSEDLGGFRERIARGAFRKVLTRSPDVRLLINHNSDLILARTASGTLTLREDPRGLFISGEAGDTSYARDLRVAMQRGDVSQCSFAFTVGSETWAIEKVGGEDVNVATIREIRDLFDVSVVTVPAYPQTDATIRSRVEAEQDAHRSGEARRRALLAVTEAALNGSGS